MLEGFNTGALRSVSKGRGSIDALLTVDCSVGRLVGFTWLVKVFTAF